MQNQSQVAALVAKKKQTPNIWIYAPWGYILEQMGLIFLVEVWMVNTYHHTKP